MTVLEEFRPAKTMQDEPRSPRPLRTRRTPRCPFLDEKLICKISRDFVEKGLRNEVFLCTASEFYVNCDIYKTYWHSGGENEIE